MRSSIRAVAWSLSLSLSRDDTLLLPRIERDIAWRASEGTDDGKKFESGR